MHAFVAAKATSRVAAPLPFDVQATSKAVTIPASTAVMFVVINAVGVNMKRREAVEMLPIETQKNKAVSEM
eukprot:3312540-Pleurochrysis_carterae.AAC.1